MQSSELRLRKHARIAQRFMDAAELYLRDGDVIQTSEKLWGATAHSIKVYCISRGWQLGKYAHLQRAMRQLVRETEDDF